MQYFWRSHTLCSVSDVKKVFIFYFFNKQERWQSSYIKVMNYLSTVCHINLKSTCESSERCTYLFRSDTKQVKIAFLQLIAVTGAYIMTDAPGLPLRSRQQHRSRLRSWLWHPDFLSFSPSVFSQACEPRPWGQPALFFPSFSSFHSCRTANNIYRCGFNR